MKKDYCIWCYEHDYQNGHYYITECNKTFSFTSGILRENHFIFCPFCGGEIKEKWNGW